MQNNSNNDQTYSYSLIKAILLLVSLTTVNGLYAQELVLTMINTGNSPSVNSVCFSPDGQYGLSGSFDKTLILWNVTTGKKIHSFAVHTIGVESVCFTRWEIYVIRVMGSDNQNMENHSIKEMSLYNFETV